MRSFALCLTHACLASLATAAPLEYAPAPPDNPLKGFAPYAGQAKDFPHSLEFRYIPLGKLMTGPKTFDLGPIEDLLKETAGRGCQAVFRVYVQYESRRDGMPQFLLDAGVKVDPLPDYEDPRLRAAIVRTIAELGRRYDGDPRVGFITAGFLGNWGEWHTHPLPRLWASKAVQIEVMDAYQKAFRKTPILVRYPAGENDPSYAPNHLRPFGYHDDSFAWATLPTGRPQDNWFFLPRMQRAGEAAVAKWQTQPIGGEVRPEVWRGLWSEESSTPRGQEFLRCVEETHATWLMDSSIAQSLGPDQRQRAIAGARRLGYEFQVTAGKVTGAGRRRSVVLMVVNKGVAPFYADWPVELRAIDADGRQAATWRPGWKLAGLLPGEPPRRWDHSLAVPSLPPGKYRLLVGVPNPMPGGRPLRLANRGQDRDLPGWLTVAEFDR